MLVQYLLEQVIHWHLVLSAAFFVESQPPASAIVIVTIEPEFQRWADTHLRECKKTHITFQEMPARFLGRLVYFKNHLYFYSEEITKFTGEPCTTEAPLAGSWLITLPVATVLPVC